LYVGSIREYTLGEEFSDFVLVDEKRNSVIINIETEYFKTVFKEYKRLGFKLIHVTRFSDEEKGMTCVFVKEP
jgi:hypothetical protein